MTGMTAVLTKAAAFVLIIVTGYLLKKKGVFHPEDFSLLSKIVIRITLPCAIIANFSNITMEYSLLFLCLMGFVFNLLMVGIGYLKNIRKDGDTRAFDMVNLSGYNIGNFTLPFVQSFLGPTGFAATSLFDAGNAIMCTGVTYALASMTRGGGGQSSVKQIFKTLFSSLPFDAYVIMTILTILHISLPQVVLSYAQTVGNANAFLALFMIGIGFEIRMEREKLWRMFSLMGIRYGMALVIALAVYFLLPFSLEIRQAMAIVAFGPISSVSPAFTEKLEGDVALSSAVNSLSIVLSIVTITLTLLIVL